MSNSERSILKKFDDFNADDRITVRLLENSVFFLTGEITDLNVEDCIRWITYENLEKGDNKLLTLYINSTGGDLYQAFALIDMMRTSRHPIRTIGIGAVMSAAFLIFSSGSQGERYAGKFTSFMCHQYSGEIEGKHHDIRATIKESENCNSKMIEILKDATGLLPSKIKSKLLSASDVYLTSDEAVELNIVDYIL